MHDKCTLLLLLLLLGEAIHVGDPIRFRIWRYGGNGGDLNFCVLSTPLLVPALEVK